MTTNHSICPLHIVGKQMDIPLTASGPTPASWSNGIRSSKNGDTKTQTTSAANPAAYAPSTYTKIPVAALLPSSNPSTNLSWKTVKSGKSAYIKTRGGGL